MAEVKIEDVVYHLDREFRRALVETIAQVAPNADYDEHAAFRFFQKRVYRHCSVWESIPDDLVRK